MDLEPQSRFGDKLTLIPSDLLRVIASSSVEHAVEVTAKRPMFWSH